LSLICDIDRERVKNRNKLLPFSEPDKSYRHNHHHVYKRADCKECYKHFFTCIFGICKNKIITIIYMYLYLKKYYNTGAITGALLAIKTTL
jgi:hypothetical protein